MGQGLIFIYFNCNNFFNQTLENRSLFLRKTFKIQTNREEIILFDIYIFKFII